MGTGASLRRASEPGKYRAPETSAARETSPSRSRDDGAGNVRPCDRCGEMRRTTRFGGDGCEWLCAACQLAGGAQERRGMKESADVARPQLRRGHTVGDISEPLGAPMGRASTISAPSTGQDTLSKMAQSNAAGRRSRRGAKERQLSMNPNPSQVGSERKVPQLMRSNTTSLELKLSPRSNYRSHQGLQALKEQMGVPPAASKEEPPSSQLALAPAPRRRLAAGFWHGDAVLSLVSRLRSGVRVLELGHEGAVVGVSRGGGPANPEEDVRLLVQFRPGFDWYLPPLQISTTSSYSSARTAGLPGGYSWGSRVQSLVTYLHRPSAKKEIWLGDCGTVVGPGLVPGKLAVRFDDDRGEWSMWPNTICVQDDYEASVIQRLQGGLSRGDRVKALGACKGVRSGGAAARAPLGLEEGEQGTVVGPGHSGSHVLVHFDSDERVWSLSPDQLVPANGRNISCV